MRKRLKALGIVAVWVVSFGAAEVHVGVARGQESADRVDQAINRAVLFLVSKQAKDGAITEGKSNSTAMTALAIMAMASVGHQPTDPTREGAAMKKALQFVLRDDRQDKMGYLGRADGSRMYGHGIITLMLAEMLGMGVDSRMDEQIRDHLQKAVRLIVRSQSVRKKSSEQGGWRYKPDSRDSDLSVTVWHVMALRAAFNAGVEVPKEAIQRAIGYVKRCYYSRERAKNGDPKNLKSGCGYKAGSGPKYSMAAAGLLALQVCGDYDCLEVQGSAEWLKDRKLNYSSDWFFYGTYYYAQGMYQRGGDYAAIARKSVEDVLLAKQEGNGSWVGRHSKERGTGRVYSTSLGVLCLAVKYHFLPIYQR